MAQNLAQSFVATPISMKLDEDNYLQWKDQAESKIEGNDMLNHLTDEDIPHSSLPDGSANSEFKKWKRQDALLKSWLLASMSKPFTTRMVGCVTYQVWKRLEDYFSSQIKAKVMQLKNKLSMIQIGASVTDYVLSINSTIDALASVGESMKERDHVNAMLHGLTEDYAPIITSVLARSQSIIVGELEALLLAHESMLTRFRKSESLVQANVAQHSQFSQNQNQF
ncbi:Homeobox protein HD-1 [Stylosanthes scabra]|uniref:Homeobox protein HD-1 n=1 Tax=Stylosanthes scabra TaxID=79078 RepID=A0ABU6RQ51_9FABA|nr:Homeobox protein HD-1 [Stylosanthes scabra]